MERADVIRKVSETLVKAGSAFQQDKKKAYDSAILAEENLQAKWVLETILENARVAEQNCSPLCDDTGIPHLLLEAGGKKAISGELLTDILEGIREGLRMLPGRPMAIKGDDSQRLGQSGGLDEDPGALDAAPIMIRPCKENIMRLHILMFGGGSAIRAKTYHVYHKHSTQIVLNEIVNWANESVALLGCTPCTLGVGIGRSHYEASALMLQALVDGKYDLQSKMEAEITRQVNETNVGPLGLHGKTTVLATYLKIGPQRASGVRIVCLRPCCCFEPRIASVEL